MVYHLGGVPALSGGLPIIVGNVYFVSSVIGSSAYDGSRDKPYRTVQDALNKSTNNDCIILMPGHTESLTTTGNTVSSGALTVDSSHVNVTVWGLGNYDYQPTFTLSSASAKVQIAGANTRLHNIKLISGTTATANGILVEAKGAMITNCRFEEVVASTYCFHDCITTSDTNNGSDGLYVANCYFQQPTAAGSCSILILGAHHEVTILNNDFVCGWTSAGTAEAPILMADTVSIYGLNIGYNRISVAMASGTAFGINVGSKVGKGCIHNNYVQCESSAAGGDGIPAVLVNATATISCINNYISGESGESGLLSPPVYAT